MQNIAEGIMTTLLKVLYEKHLTFTSVVLLRSFNILQGNKKAERKSLQHMTFHILIPCSDIFGNTIHHTVSNFDII